MLIYEGNSENYVLLAIVLIFSGVALDISYIKNIYKTYIKNIITFIWEYRFVMNF